MFAVDYNRRVSRWGENIIRLRKARGIGQVELAKAAGIDKSTLNRIEKQDDSKPNLDVLLKIADRLKVDVSEIFAPPSAKGASGEFTNGGESGGTRIEDRLGGLLAFIKTLDDKTRTQFVRGLIALLTALEHARPAAGTGTAADDGR